MDTDEESASEKVKPFLVWGNILCILQGLGVMGIPYAFSRAPIIAFAANVLFAFTCCFTGKLIIRSWYKPLAGFIRGTSTYSNVAAKAFSENGRKVVLAMVIVEIFGATTIFTVFLKETLESLLTSLGIYEHLGHFWLVLIVYSSMILLMIKNRKIISIFSAFASLAIFLAIVILLIFCITEMSLGAVDWWNYLEVDWKNLPASLGIILFSYSIHPILPNIEACMAEPESFDPMMNITHGISALTKTVFGLLPVAVFGLKTHDIFSHNMKNRFTMKILMEVALCLYVYFSYPVLLFSFGQQFKGLTTKVLSTPCLEGKALAPHFWLFINRLVTLSAALGLAIAVPYFTQVLNIVSALTVCNLCLTLPAAIYFHLFYSELNKCHKFILICIMLFGSVLALTLFTQSVVFFVKVLLRKN